MFCMAFYSEQRVVFLHLVISSLSLRTNLSSFNYSSHIKTFYSATEYNILCTLHLYSRSTLGSNLHLIIKVTSKEDLKNVIYSVSTLGSTLGMSSFLADAIMIMNPR